MKLSLDLKETESFNQIWHSKNPNTFWSVFYFVSSFFFLAVINFVIWSLYYWLSIPVTIITLGFLAYIFYHTLIFRHPLYAVYDKGIRVRRNFVFWDEIEKIRYTGEHMDITRTFRNNPPKLRRTPHEVIFVADKEYRMEFDSLEQIKKVLPDKKIYKETMEDFRIEMQVLRKKFFKHMVLLISLIFLALVFTVFAMMRSTTLK